MFVLPRRLLLLRKKIEALQKFIPARARQRRVIYNKSGIRCTTFNRALRLGLFGLFELVPLGEHDAERTTAIVEELHHFPIGAHPRMPRIDEQNHKGDFVPLDHIVRQQLPPALSLAVPDLGIPIPRQIDEVEVVVDEEIVDETSLPRRRAGLGQPLAGAKRIQQRRLPHIRPSDENDFWATIGWKAVQARITTEKVGGGDVHWEMGNGESTKEKIERNSARLWFLAQGVKLKNNDVLSQKDK